MVHDYREEMYDILIKAAAASDAQDHASLLWDAAGPAGMRVKQAELRSKNFELMLLRLVRQIRAGKSAEQLSELAERAAGLLGRHGTRSPLR